MTTRWRSYCFLTVCCSALVFTKIHGAFEGFQLLSLTPQTRNDVAFVYGLTDEFVDLDLWQYPSSPGLTVRMLVPPGLLPIAQDKLTGRGIPWETVDVDVAETVRASRKKNNQHQHSRVKRAAATAAADIVDHDNYHKYDQIEAYLRRLEEEYPDTVELFKMDYFTREGRSVWAVKVHGPGAGDHKPVVIAEAGIHAREWITPAATLYVIEKLLQGYKNGTSQATAMLDPYDWYFIPVLNPDGYEFSNAHENNRMWRKNRRRYSLRCVGVDLNRNFDIEHGTTGVSSRCDSNIYPGDHGFSEPETANVRALFNRLQDRVFSYLSIHSYSQLVIVPWGYVLGVSRPENYQELDRVAHLMAEAIHDSGNQTYRVGTAYQLLEYAASGASEDWALSQKAGIYAYCYELRPSSGDPRGFLLPPDEIVPTGQELLASMYVLANEMNRG